MQQKSINTVNYLDSIFVKPYGKSLCLLLALKFHELTSKSISAIFYGSN